ncbi:MAG: hypothetical protein L0287_17935 [Anaerolineae bacterium]|nr:hypothetical protein [Anaerolineae bacterium]
MGIPIPGVKDVIDGISLAVKWFDMREKQFLLDAWTKVELGDAYRTIVEYYSEFNQSLFSYPQPNGGRIRMPLYVEDGWDRISSSTLKMKFENITKPFYPISLESKFFDFYNELKEKSLFDSNIFRLIDIEYLNGSLNLSFELGKFYHSVMCQYILEHELLTLLARDIKPPREKFVLRNSVAANSTVIHSFFQHKVGRIGINNLILLRKDKYTYIPMVQKRSLVSMLQQGLFDQVSSCIFEVITTPKADFELQHTVLREIHEELYGNPELIESSRRLDPYFFYKDDGINDLRYLLQNGSAVFDVTGFCIDLIRIVPEITTILLVRDEEYYKRHFKPTGQNVAMFYLNEEFELGSLFHIPADLDDVDEYLRTEVISDPDGDPKKKGFNPLNWTLPAGFSFYQGLKRAVEKRLS